MPRATPPCGVIDGESGTIFLPPGPAEHAPGSDDIGGWITGTGGAEVDDGARRTFLDEQVRSQEVGVDPHWRALPCRGSEGVLPGRRGGAAVDGAHSRVDGPTRERVELDQRLPARGRHPGRVDAPKLMDEAGEIGGRLALVGDQSGGIRLALDPAIDRPGKRITARRTTLPNRFGDSQGQVWHQRREPAQLLLEVGHPSGRPWEARREPNADPVDGVHRPCRPNGGDVQAGEIGELADEQLADQLDVDVHLVVVHPHRQ